MGAQKQDWMPKNKIGCHERGIPQLQNAAAMVIMAIRVVEFSNWGTKLERFLNKNQHTQRKLLNLENWVNGELSKIGHHFRKLSDLKIDAIKKCQ